MKWLWPIALQLIAFGVAMAETLIPSFGILAAISVGLLGLSWYLILNHLPETATWIFGLADIMLIPVGLWLGLKLMSKSPLTHRNALSSGTGLEAEENTLSQLIGTQGTVASRLRPSGKVTLGENIYEALTSGEFLEEGLSIKVVGIKSGALLVERYN